MLRALLRIRVRVNGTPVRGRAVLYVLNHMSWADIVVTGSLAPFAFVAKREVASWPLVGIDAVVSYGEPVAACAATDRKAMAKALETVVRGLTTAALHGRTPRPPAVPQAS